MRRNPSTPFLLGVNYPWLHYGEDFGLSGEHHHGVSLPSHQKRIAGDFAATRACGISVVRWFLFADGRAGFLSEKGIAAAPDALLLKDVDTALQLAESAGLKLCFALFDYLWLQKKPKTARRNPHSHVLHSAAGRQSFLERVLLPLFREFRAHPALYAWDIANEPEWAIREFHPISFAKMRLVDFLPFAHKIVQSVHEFAAVPSLSVQPAFLGCVPGAPSISTSSKRTTIPLSAFTASPHSIANSIPSPVWRNPCGSANFRRTFRRRNPIPWKKRSLFVTMPASAAPRSGAG
jgi:hypothetical protein